MRVTVLAILVLLPTFCAAACDSSAPLGPTVQSGGVCFRVWAPHALAATVLPVTGGWQPSSMKPSSSGIYTAFVSNAKVGDEFQYQFSTSSGNITRVDPRAQGIDSNMAFSIIEDTSFDWGDTAEVSLPTPANAVVYEMHIASFNADGGVGTFKSAAAKLPYLASLGINVVELMPISKFGGDARGWGYDPAAPFAVEPAYGGAAGLKAFVKAANAHGIAVMVDVVWNHMWESNVLEAYDGYKGDAGHGIYFYEDGGDAQTPWGPRPKYDEAQVQAYILDLQKVFMTEYHVSGFRWDSTICIRKPGPACWTMSDNLAAGWTLMQAANDAMREMNPNAISAAEDTQGWADITKATSDKSAGLPGAPGGAGFTAQWGYVGFFYDVQAALIIDDNADVDVDKIAQLLATSTEGTRVLFTENHDQASNQNKGRIPAIVNPGGSPTTPNYWAQKKAMMGLSFIFTAPGIPMLLQGQEFMTYAAFDFPNPPPLDWALTSLSIVKEVKDLIKLRTSTPALASSNGRVVMTANTASDKVAVVYRWTTGSDVVCIYNLRSKSYNGFQVQNMPKDGTWNVVFNGDRKSYSSLFTDFGISQTSVAIQGGAGSVALPPYSMVVLVKQ